MITVKNIVLRRGAKVLLDKASVTLNPGEKIGLVGRNGAGKSSLFRLLDRTLHEDGGEFYIPPQWRMAQVAQDMPETDMPATQYVVEGDVTLLAAQEEVEAAEATDDGEVRQQFSLAFRCRLIGGQARTSSESKAGTKKSTSIAENPRPKAIEVAIGIRNWACNELSKSRGVSPPMVVSEVSSTARRRPQDAPTRASFKL